MFNDKPYLEVNREERHFCFLLAHSILSSSVFCTRFNRLLESKLNIDIGVETPKIYLEAATLRDYWRDLGDPKAYTQGTHESRSLVINHILEIAQYQDVSIDEYDFFWTTPSHQKLWSPGRWSEKAIHAHGLSNLQNIKWAFNAKPDILLDYHSVVVLVEAKVHSPLGRTSEGYEQTEVQKVICKLINQLVPNYTDKDFHFILLSNDETSGMYWHEIATISEHAGLDSYTEQSLHQSSK